MQMISDYIPQTPPSASRGPAATASPAANLYIYRLPTSWTEAEFVQTFMPYGRILSSKIAKNTDGSSRGYGFVAYDNLRSAKIAIAALDGIMVEGKLMSVSFKDSGGPSVAKSVPAGANVYVCNLPVAWVETDLQKAFQA